MIPEQHVLPATSRTKLCKLHLTTGMGRTEFCTASNTPVKFSHYPQFMPSLLFSPNPPKGVVMGLVRDTMELNQSQGGMRICLGL